MDLLFTSLGHCCNWAQLTLCLFCFPLFFFRGFLSLFSVPSLSGYKINLSPFLFIFNLKFNAELLSSHQLQQPNKVWCPHWHVQRSSLIRNDRLWSPFCLNSWAMTRLLPHLCLEGSTGWGRGSVSWVPYAEERAKPWLWASQGLNSGFSTSWLCDLGQVP